MDYAVVMAGGSGKRLWPLSRQKRPKQVLKLFDGQTLLGRCFNRLRSIFDQRNIIILTNAGYADMVRENLPEIPFENVIGEPVVRDTTGAQIRPQQSRMPGDLRNQAELSEHTTGLYKTGLASFVPGL
jgi:mannose-1-phosphate guanylyltransferase